MRRLFVLGVVAIALLGLGGVVLVELVTAPALDRAVPQVAQARDALLAQDAAAPVHEPAAYSPPGPSFAGPASASDLRVPPSNATLAVQRLPPRAGSSAPEPWVSVPLKPRDIRTLWIEIARERPELPGCWANEPRAVLRPGPRRKAQAGAPAALLLELESTGDTLRVVSAPVESQGEDSDATVACAQAQLRELTIDVPATVAGTALVTPGARTRLRYVLQ
jgi:hypothetical protein